MPGRECVRLDGRRGGVVRCPRCVCRSGRQLRRYGGFLLGLDARPFRWGERYTLTTWTPSGNLPPAVFGSARPPNSTLARPTAPPLLPQDARTPSPRRSSGQRWACSSRRRAGRLTSGSRRSIYPLSVPGMGRAVLAQRPFSEVVRLSDALELNEGDALQRLERELAEFRELGYGTSLEEYQPGINAVAVTVVGADREIALILCIESRGGLSRPPRAGRRTRTLAILDLLRDTARSCDRDGDLGHRALRQARLARLGRMRLRPEARTFGSCPSPSSEGCRRTRPPSAPCSGRDVAARSPEALRP